MESEFMSIKLAVAVTDDDWFEHLRTLAEPSEVNFWATSARRFGALQKGELFLFKLHAPRNLIVGGGIFAHTTVLPLSLAWEAFGETNGARSEQEMRNRLATYRRSDPTDRSDYRIGCRILAQPFFFDEPDWIPVPPSWSPRTVSLKTYSTSDAEGLDLWKAVTDRLGRAQNQGVDDDRARFGEPQLLDPRLGQGGFRVLVTDVYERRCAVTQERTLPVLEAAHIRPYSDGGLHEASNGLLLRRDVHKLFDTGYVTVTPDHSFEVSRRIREEFENGRMYYAYHGTQIDVPGPPDQHPDPEALAWHNEHCFRG